MILINEGIPQKLLDAVATGIQNSDAFSLPTKATQLTWQTSFGVAPASITVQLQTSLDNSLWSTIDTSTSVAGEDRTIATSALFIRARINAISGGSAITVQLVCKTGFIGLTTPSLVTDGAIALFDGTTGSKLKELLFPGGTTTFLRADGTFAVAGGGGGGTPASPDTSIQFNNAGSFGGSANLEWDGTNLNLGAGHGLAFVAFGSGATITNDFGEILIDAVGNNEVDISFNQPVFITSETSITSDVSIFKLGLSLDSSIEETGTNILSYGIIKGFNNQVEESFNSATDATGYGINNTYNLNGVGSRVNGEINGILNQINLNGAKTLTDAFAITNSLIAQNGATISNAYLYYGYLNGSGTGAFTNAFMYYGKHIGGASTNMYFQWFDTDGVFRIREDNTFNSVNQAIMALYNPQFTKYTPGAADYERIVQQWESNVAVIRTEKGGSGTLRDINIAGAHFRVNNNIGIAASVTTAALVGKTMTFVDGILTGFA